MKKIRYAMLIMLMAFTFSISRSATFSNETLHYVVSYKWGLIHKDAGEATLKLDNKGSKYNISLTAKTKPWADNIYQVRDTLVGIIKKEGFRPLSYSKIAHENGKYSRDDILYTYHSDYVAGAAKRTRQDKKGKLTVTEKQLHGTGNVFDMLSVFYYLRIIDYSKLDSGEVIKTTVFSGSKVETLTIRCVGKEEVKMRNKTKRKGYHIKFKFTQKGKKKSSDDIDAWISTDTSHVPLLVVGSLPVGQVKCYLMN